MLSTVTDALDVMVSPKESVNVPVHVNDAVGEELVDVTVRLVPVPTVDPAESVHTNVGFSVPSSISSPTAPHVKTVPTTTLLFGVMNVGVVKVGVVFSMVTVADEVSLPPFPSSTVTVHSTTSEGETTLVDSWILAVLEGNV